MASTLNIFDVLNIYDLLKSKFRRYGRRKIQEDLALCMALGTIFFEQDEAGVSSVGYGWPVENPFVPPHKYPELNMQGPYFFVEAVWSRSDSFSLLRLVREMAKKYNQIKYLAYYKRGKKLCVLRLRGEVNEQTKSESSGSEGNGSRPAPRCFGSDRAVGEGSAPESSSLFELS